MNIMKFFGFETDEDDYDDYDDTEEEKRTPRKQSSGKREASSSRSSTGSSNAGGRLIIYNGIPDDNDKRRLREAFNDGAMLLIDLHLLNQREFDEEGKDFITFMGGVAFARKGEIKFIEPAQYLLTPRVGMYEIWPERSEPE